MKKCPNINCQSENPDDAKYCHMCGQKLQKSNFNGFIYHYDRMILCGLGLFLIILALCGIGTLLNAISGGCMIGAAILLPELKK